MSLSLLTNVASLAAQRNVNNTQSLLENSVERLSSGMRINHASDDAAGLAISSQLTAELRGMAQAQRNANDGVSMIQTAEGALGEINNMLARMRELSVESANGGTLGSTQRTALNTEFTALTAEITRIVQVSNYNGQQLIDGSLTNTATPSNPNATFQVGAYNSTSNQIGIAIANSDLTSLGLNSSAIDTISNAQNAMAAIDSAITTVASTRATIGASQSRLAVTIDNLSQTYTNLSAANSRILDVDVAAETATMTKNQILLQAGISVLAQANQAPSAALSLLGK